MEQAPPSRKRARKVGNVWQLADVDREAAEAQAAEGMQEPDGVQPTVLAAPGAVRKAPDPGPIVLHAWEGVCALPLRLEPAESEAGLAEDETVELLGEAWFCVWRAPAECPGLGPALCSGWHLRDAPAA